MDDRLSSAPRRLPGGALVYLKRERGANQFRLVQRAGPTAPESVLVDPDALERRTGRPHAIDWFEPSPDGRVVGRAKNVSELATLVKSAPLDAVLFHAKGGHFAPWLSMLGENGLVAKRPQRFAVRVVAWLLRPLRGRGRSGAAPPAGASL